MFSDTKRAVGNSECVVGIYLMCSSIFYAPQLVPAGTAESRISYGNSVRLSVCLSVCHDPVVYQAQVR